MKRFNRLGNLRSIEDDWRFRRQYRRSSRRAKQAAIGSLIALAVIGVLLLTAAVRG